MPPPVSLISHSAADGVAERRKRQYSMLECAPDVFLRFNRDLVLIYANRASERYFHMPAPRPNGMYPCEDFDHCPERVRFYQSNAAEVFATGRVLSVACTLDLIPGRVAAEFYFWPEFADDGKVASVLCQMLDRSAQARVEDAKRLNDERLNALNRLTQMQDDSEEEIIEFVLDQMVVMTRSTYSCLFFPSDSDPTRGMSYLSKEVRALPGVDEWPIDRMPQQFLPGNLHIDLQLTTLQVSNGRSDGECYLSYRDRRVRRYVILPSLEDGRTVCVASVGNKDTDYDESDLRQLELLINGVWLVLRRKRYLRTLENAKEAAEAANRAKDAFLANVSHELRTPLNGMLGMLQLLRLSGLTEEQTRQVEAADLSGRTLLRILSDILDFSRLEAGKMALSAAPFNLRETLVSTMRLFADEAGRKGLTVDVDLDPSLPGSLEGDEARLRQIVFNLAGNALKFTEKGGIRLECRVLPYATGGKIRIYLALSDTGIGIPDHAHDRIFEAFTQLDNSRTRPHSGTGLGLGIVKRLLQIMGGCLTVESEPDRGTTMHCSLPFSPAAAPAARPRRRIEKARQRRLDILVAEDDGISRIVMQNFLETAGHRAVCVESGQKALAALRLHAFDCLITDIQMPIMDGIEATQRIRRGEYADIRPDAELRAAVRKIIPEVAAKGEPLRDIPRDLPVAALTAHAMSGDRELFLKSGMDLYLSKPLLLEALTELTDHIAEHR